MTVIAYILILFLTFLFAFIIIFLITNKILTYRASRNFEEYDKDGKVEYIDGIKVFYREAGEGETILLIHGFMGASIYFEELMRELSKKFRVVAVDLIGFGNSDKSIKLNYAKRNMGKIADALMKSKGVESYHLLGHSMGGGVALNIVNDKPNTVKSLILVDSVGYAVPKRPSIPPIIIDKFVKAYLTQKLFHRFNFYDKTKIKEKDFLKIFYYNNQIPGKTLHKFSREDDSGSMEENTSNINCRTLIIWGREDKIIKVESAYKFKRDIKNSTLCIFEGCGHIPFVEKPREFLDCVMHFLQ